MGREAPLAQRRVPAAGSLLSGPPPPVFRLNRLSGVEDSAMFAGQRGLGFCLSRSLGC